LTLQDKNKYNSPKYRFVTRFTNTDIVCQIVSAKIVGDVTICAAYSHELPRYGITVGLTNYAAAYATGLLCARRLLQKLKLDSKYEGKKDVTGEMYSVAELGDDEPRPFCALLDVGLHRTTTGAKVFGCLKGAVDGGIEVPHSEKRFPGYDSESKAYDPAIHRARIFGQHVANYMTALKDEDPEKYKAHFSRFIEKKQTPESLEKMYKTGHAAIRKDPSGKPTAKKPESKKRWNKAPISNKQRKERVRQRLASAGFADK